MRRLAAWLNVRVVAGVEWVLITVVNGSSVTYHKYELVLVEPLFVLRYKWPIQRR
jgi:hypothetical protein